MRADSRIGRVTRLLSAPLVGWLLLTAVGCGQAPADAFQVANSTQAAPDDSTADPTTIAPPTDSNPSSPAPPDPTPVSAPNSQPGGIFLNATVGGSTKDLTSRIAGDPRIAGIQVDLRWRDLAPAEDAYDWTRVDTLLAQYAAIGKRVGFKFWAVGPSADLSEDLTPAWLWNAGTIASVGNRDTPAGFAPRMPVYWDEQYLAQLGRFLAAMGARYDGDPRLAYIRMGGWQCGTNEPNFYGDFSASLGDQLAAQGMPIAAARLTLLADQPYTAATLRMIDLWHAAFPNSQLIATIHFNDDPRDFEYAMNQHCLELGLGLMNTGLNEGDKSDARARFRRWRDSLGVRAGWGGVSNLGQKQPTLSDLPLRMEMVLQGTGRDDDTYAPFARTAYMVFGDDILDFDDALSYAFAHLEP